MAESAIPLRATDPVFEDVRDTYTVQSGSAKTFNIARAGYKAVGITMCNVENITISTSTYNDKPIINFDYSNQTIRCYASQFGGGSSSIVHFTVTIKYMKL